jgi:endonuclease YncB( thermonuclease family)
VELAPSRIRREPVRETKKIEPRSREFEIWVGITGIVVFAVIIASITIGFSIITANHAAGASTIDNGKFGPCDTHSNCVLDGDTIRLRGTTMAIAGMDVPQIANPRCDGERERGIEASERLTDFLNRGRVTTAGDVRDPDGQVRTQVLVGGQDVAAAMISAGVARQAGSVAPAAWCDEG